MAASLRRLEGVLSARCGVAGGGGEEMLGVPMWMKEVVPVWGSLELEVVGIVEVEVVEVEELVVESLAVGLSRWGRCVQ